jgi:hypothetical protein
VATPKEADYFPTAQNYLDFFLLIYSLVSGQAVTTIMGIGTTLDNISSLGTKRVSFPSFKKIHVHGEDKDNFLTKPILDAKKRFLLMQPDRERIMGSSLGLALRYYYFAVLASSRRLEEAVVDLMTAGEALLITKDERIRGPLSKRLSTLVAENKVEATEILKKMRKLYDLRCGIVHGRGKKPSFNDMKTLFSYVRRAIDRSLSLRHLSKEELVGKLDKAYAEDSTL